MFSESERKIFGPYFNGVEMVYADPIRVHRRLQFMLDGEVNKHLAKARSEDSAERYQAKEKLLPAVVYALDLVAFDPKSGQGALEQDVIAALRAYLEFMEKKDSPGLTLPTCLPSSPLSAVGPGFPQTIPPGYPFGAFSDANNLGQRGS